MTKREKIAVEMIENQIEKVGYQDTQYWAVREMSEAFGMVRMARKLNAINDIQGSKFDDRAISACYETSQPKWKA